MGYLWVVDGHFYIQNGLFVVLTGHKRFYFAQKT